MSKERLSHLQKWMLIQALKNDFYLIPGCHFIYEGFWGKEKVWRRYCQKYDMRGNASSFYKYNLIDDKFRVSLSRSKKQLLKKGLVEKHFLYKSLQLTVMGKQKAKSLLLTSRGVNNKQERQP